MSKVYVLGAGASRGLNKGAPLMADLLKEALKFSLYVDRKSDSFNAADNIKKFLNEIYSSDGQERIPPFEDVLSLLDYCVGSNVPLSGDYSVRNLRDLRDDLIYIMGRVLQENMRDNTTKSLADSFVTSLSPTDRIISFNYDLIVDNALLRKYKSIDYYIPVRNASTNQPNHGIYKLHGSLNWLYCPVCRELETTDTRKQALETLKGEKPCSKCDTQMEPILITPSFLKDYNNSFITQLWQEAEHCLHQANEIVFVGYSMPDADIFLRMFLTRAVYANKLIHGRRCKISVIDYVKPECRECYSTEMTDIHKRYVQLFGDVDYDFTGFKEYIQRGCRTVNQQSPI